MEDKNGSSMEQKLSNNFIWHWTGAVRTKAKERPAGGIVIRVRKGIERRKFKSNPVECWAAIGLKINKKWIKVIAVYNNTSLEVMKDEG